MKKTLIALAAASSASIGFAQSSLTISGDLWAGYNSVTSSAGIKTNSLGNGPTGSRLRFVGSEDMGGGTKANFQLEMQPNLSAGTVNGNNVATTTTGALFNRAAWVGMTGGLGEFRLGRTNTISLQTVCVAVDPTGCTSSFNGGGILFSGTNAQGRWISANPSRGLNAAAGVPVSSGNSSAAGTTATNTGPDSTRVINALTYVSPNMSGITAMLQYASGNLPGNAANGGGNASSIAINYANGPLSFGGSIQSAGADPRLNATGKQTTLGGAYNFGFAKAGLVFQNGSASAGAGAVLNFTSEKAWAFTLSAPMGKALPYLRLGQHKTNGTGSYGVVNGADAKMLNIGMNYELSKRTKLNFDYSRDNAGNSGLAGNNTNPSLAYIGFEHHF